MNSDYPAAWLNQTSGISVALAGLMGVAPSSPPLDSVVGRYVGGQASGRTMGLSAAFIPGLATIVIKVFLNSLWGRPSLFFDAITSIGKPVERTL